MKSPNSFLEIEFERAYDFLWDSLFNRHAIVGADCGSKGRAAAFAEKRHMTTFRKREQTQEIGDFFEFAILLSDEHQL